MGDTNGLQDGIHAEHDAIRKLHPLRRAKKLETIHILVVRLSKTNKLQSSKPCFKCINMMKDLPQKFGYKIQNVYYSDTHENIVKTTLCKLDNEDKHYGKRYRRNTTM